LNAIVWYMKCFWGPSEERKKIKTHSPAKGDLRQVV
jgi:hypothetical protein